MDLTPRAGVAADVLYRNRWLTDFHLGALVGKA